MSLIYKLNKGKTQIKEFYPFQDYAGTIPETVGEMRKEGRTFAGGNIVLKERLDALISKDEDRIESWGLNGFTLADACFILDDKVKLQTDSPFLTGIRGVVETQDGLRVAIDSTAVESAISKGGWKYFINQHSKSATLNYDSGYNEKGKIVENVVLLPYTKKNISLTPDQFRAVNTEEISRKKISFGEKLKIGDIIKNDTVVHPVWKMYSPGIVIPLVEETFNYVNREFNSNTSMGVFLLSEQYNDAEILPLCIGGLSMNSTIHGVVMGQIYNKLVGKAISNESVEDVTRELDTIYTNALLAMKEGNSILHTPKGDYILAKERMQPT